MCYVWQHPNWPEFTWQSDLLLDAVSRARLCQGKLLSKVNALGMYLNREAQAKILTEESIKTAAVEGQTLDRDSVRSSVARRLGLPTAGLPAPAVLRAGLPPESMFPWQKLAGQLLFARSPIL
jgi:Fic family protein